MLERSVLLKTYTLAPPRAVSLVSGPRFCAGAGQACQSHHRPLRERGRRVATAEARCQHQEIRTPGHEARSSKKRSRDGAKLLQRSSLMHRQAGGELEEKAGENGVRRASRCRLVLAAIKLYSLRALLSLCATRMQACPARAASAGCCPSLPQAVSVKAFSACLCGL